jgi:hypothetical protein
MYDDGTVNPSARSKADVAAWCELVLKNLIVRASRHDPPIALVSVVLVQTWLLTVDYIDPWEGARHLRLRRDLREFLAEDGPWWTEGYPHSPVALPPPKEIAQVIVEGDLGEPLGRASVNLRLDSDGVPAWGSPFT